MDKKEKIIKKVERKTNLSIVAPTLLSKFKIVGITVGVIFVIGFIIVKILFKKDNTKKLLDVVSDELDNSIKKKEEVVKKYEDEIKKIHDKRNKDIKEIEDANDKELDEIIKRKGL